MTSMSPPDVFGPNMNHLKRFFPEIYRQLHNREITPPFLYEVTKAASGDIDIVATLEDGNHIPFYGQADISGSIREMTADWQLESADFLFCIGLGLGYVPLLASQVSSGKPRIVVMEPHPEIFILAMKTIDLRTLIAYERLDLYLGPDLPVSDIIAKYNEQIFFGKNRLVSHGPSRGLYGDAFTSLEHEVVENIRVVRNIGYTAKHTGKQIYLNTMKNLPNLFAGPDLSALKGRFKGCPAICVAAGPSLDNALAELKDIGNRALILCADSAARALVQEAIIPHIVVTSDMNAVNFEKLRTSLDGLRESVLIFSIEANPDNVGCFPSPRRVAITSKNAILNRWLGPKWGHQWQVPAMTSVSHSALFTAMALGAEPIILVGMDFAFVTGKSHATSSIFRYSPNMKDAIYVEGVKGYDVPATPQLVTDRKQIENAMARSSVRFIDTSLDGALIGGAENRSLKEVMDTLLKNECNVSSVLEKIDWTPSIQDKTVAREFDAMAQRVDRFISKCQTHGKSCQKLLEASNMLNDRKSLASIRHTLSGFDKKNDQILGLLKLIRYRDVKEISKRLAQIQTSENGQLRKKKELNIYIDYFASLETAALEFKSQLSTAHRYFSEVSELIENIDDGRSVPQSIRRLADYYKQYEILWKAESAFVQYLEKKPEDLDVWLNLGQMFAEKKLWFLARRYVNQIKDRFSDDPKIEAFNRKISQAIMNLRDEAAVYLEDGRMEEARRKLAEYHSLVQQNATSQVLQKQIDAYDRENEKVMCTSESVEMTSVQKQILNTRIKDCLEHDAVEKAIGMLEGLTQMNDQNAWQMREKIGDIRFAQADVNAAAWHYQQALERVPDNEILASKFHNISQQKITGKDLSAKDHRGAKYGHGTASGRPKETVEEMYRKAQLKIQKQIDLHAVDALEQLLAIYPDFGPAHNDLGVLHYHLGNHEKSFFHYQHATQIDPDNCVFQKNLADFCYVVRADAQTSLKIYVDLLSKDPTDKEALLALAHICTDQDRIGDAVVFYRRILELDPTDTEARQGLSKLVEKGHHGLSG